MQKHTVQDTQQRLDAAVQQGKLAGLHGVFVLQHRLPLLAAYYCSADERMGVPLGEVAFSDVVPHDLRSVTKSIVGSLFGTVISDYGIDLRSRLCDVLASKRAQFGAAARLLTLEHVATMTMGLDWNEMMSYADPQNAERQMAAADDRIAYVLGLAAIESPGERWRYCGGATELLAAVIVEVTHTSLEDYATCRLFEPLGLTSVAWNGDAKGPYAASGLRMSLPDLARIGQCLLDGGSWEGRQLIPEAWLREAFSTRIAIDADFSYGYHFYAGSFRLGERSIRFAAGIGNGGQRLFMLPELQAVVAITAGNYNDWNTPVPASLMRDHVLPLLLAGAE